MDDLPDDVAVLQDRLKKARVEYGKLANRFAAEQSRRIAAESRVAGVLGLARDGIWPADGVSADELLTLVEQLFWDAQKASHPRAAADRRLELLRRLSRFWPADLGEAMQRVVNTSIGVREEWARLLAEVRAELMKAEEER